MPAVQQVPLDQFLREAREAAGLTVSALAKKLGVDPRTVWRYENGVLKPLRWTAIKIALAIGLPAESLARFYHEESEYCGFIDPRFRPGTIDPSDGIPFRSPQLFEEDPSRRRRGLAERCIYRKRGRWRVWIRFHQEVYDLGYFIHFGDARNARDKFYEAAYGPGWRVMLKNFSTRRRGSEKALGRSLKRLRRGNGETLASYYAAGTS